MKSLPGIYSLMNSLKFHGKSLNTGYIYVTLQGSNWNILSISDKFGDLWCVENISTGESADNTIFESFQLDKELYNNLASFIKVTDGKKAAAIKLDKDENAYILKRGRSRIKIPLPTEVAPTFGDKISSKGTTIASINQNTWKVLQKLTSCVAFDRNTVFINGILIRRNGVMYITNGMNVISVQIDEPIISKDSPYDEIFIPSEILLRNLAPLEGVYIVESPDRDLIYFDMGNIYFILNQPTDTSQIVNHDSYPVTGIEAIFNSQDDFKPIAQFNTDSVKTIQTSLDSFGKLNLHAKSNHISLASYQSTSDFNIDIDAENIHGECILTLETQFCKIISILLAGNADVYTMSVSDVKAASLWSVNINNDNIIKNIMIASTQAKPEERDGFN